MNKLDVLKDMLPTFPTGHGIYTMRDVSGTVVYIGKAKNLQSRLRSYFNGSDGRPSIPHLMKLVDRIETIATENERQSLVLEAELIRKFKPKFNIRLKDDKAYYFVRIDRNLEFPRIELTRYERKDGADYFGPYPYSRELFAILSVIKQTIPLRTCSDAVLRNRVRPCLEYQIKRCLAPCCLEVDRTQ
mgnify:CR=1 FL=1